MMELFYCELIVDMRAVDDMVQGARPRVPRGPPPNLTSNMLDSVYSVNC